jgi:hypothetical protein
MIYKRLFCVCKRRGTGISSVGEEQPIKQIQSEYSVLSNVIFLSPTQTIEVSCAVLISSAWYGNTALPQCVLCVNGQ